MSGKTDNSSSKPLSDAVARLRFVTELDRNFSIIAAAGAGKTRAITDRVVAAAIERPDLPERMAVVTYTNKAAGEMQQRARNALLAHKGGALLMNSLNTAFFGTIHSFCVMLLRRHGHHLGIPTETELIDDDNEPLLWSEFVRNLQLGNIDTGLPREYVDKCFRHLPAQEIAGLARGMERLADIPAPRAPCPDPDLAGLFSFAPGSRNRTSIEKGLSILGRWKAAYDSGAEFLTLPHFEKGGAEFAQLWRDTFEPIRKWLGICSLNIARAVAAEYRRFRMDTGRLTYSDQVSFALDLIADRHAGNALRAEEYAIILDEAQDTDPEQFRLLLALAEPNDGDNAPRETDHDLPVPAPGRFCMVGDPQQSIYGNRADLGFYGRVRQALLSAGNEELEFHTTFRCSSGVTGAANTLCPRMLDGADGQVGYVELRARPDADKGAVWIHSVPAPAADRMPDGRKLLTADLETIESESLADLFSAHETDMFGAAGWENVAVLCARKRWIDPVVRALQARGMPVQSQSKRRVHGDDPACAWFVSLMVCMAEPGNSFEIVGLLRELFGVSDDELYRFKAGMPAPFRIDRPAQGDSAPAAALNILYEARNNIAGHSIADAARTIVDAAGLRAALAALESGGDIPANPGYAATLDGLYAHAAAAETEGMTFRRWTDRLKSFYRAPVESQPAETGRIQVLTCHAAKGLEWDAVIVPFMFRPITISPPAYPYIYADTGRRSARAVFGNAWLDPDDQTRIRRAGFQETQRLLYVTMTRARHTLALIDDKTLFGPGKGSFAGCLGLEDSDMPALFGNIGGAGTPISPVQVPRTETVSAVPAVPQVPSGQTIRNAAKRAASFRRRILPSTLARHGADAEPESDRSRDPDWERGADNESVRYGRWWHGLMDTLDWSDPDSWEETFRRSVAACPDPERADTEWRAFARSSLAGRISAPGWITRTEIPFLRPAGPDRCVEGVIDLVACNKGANEWIVLDWKTDRTDPDGLAAVYGPQLAEYARAVEAAAPESARIETAIYSTFTGRTVSVP